MTEQQALGQAGERAACLYLQAQDYHIRELNWRSHPHEVDIIAEHYGEIVFVEVKTRRHTRWQAPEDAVDASKEYHLTQAALHYLRQHRLHLSPFRFDIIALVGSEAPFQLQHFREAFAPRYFL